MPSPRPWKLLRKNWKGGCNKALSDFWCKVKNIPLLFHKWIQGNLEGESGIDYGIPAFYNAHPIHSSSRNQTLVIGRFIQLESMIVWFNGTILLFLMINDTILTDFNHYPYLPKQRSALRTTWSPLLRLFTSLPTSVTSPVPSAPPTAGKDGVMPYVP